jgi:hypothetical protein
LYEETKRERRRRDLLRVKAAVYRYLWINPKRMTPQLLGRLATHHHTCGLCGHYRRRYGPPIAELRILVGEYADKRAGVGVSECVS